MRKKREKENNVGQSIDFNPVQYDLQTAMEKMPAGWYKAVINAAAIEETAAKNGIYLKLEFKIIDGPFNGRKVYNNFNLKNPNQQTVEIAMKQLATLCGCINKWNRISNTDELLNIPLQIKLSDKGDSEYNDVKGYRDINGNDPVKPGAGAQPMAAPVGGPPVAQLATPPPMPMPPAPLPPPPQPPPPPAAAFPPEGWQQHPQSATHYYKGQDVKTEAELRAMFATPTPAAVPPPPMPAPSFAAPPAYAPPQMPGAPPAAPAAAWTPGGAPPPAWVPQK